MLKKNNLFFLVIVVIGMAFVLNTFWTRQKVLCSNERETRNFFAASKKEEREFFSCLLIELFHNSTIGYTLFGDKPISVICNECSPYLDRRFFFLNLALPLIDRYEQKLTSQGFCVIVERRLERDQIYLVNKKSFCNTVWENIDVFQDVLGRDITPEKILHSIIQNRSLKIALRGNEALYGILFGFGRTNALHFERRSQIERMLHAPPRKDPTEIGVQDDRELVILYLNCKEKCKEAKESNVSEKFYSYKKFDTIQEEYRELNRRLISPWESESLFALRRTVILPGFVGDSQSTETKQLIEKYQHQRNVIMQIASDENLLELAVKKFYE